MKQTDSPIGATNHLRRKRRPRPATSAAAVAAEVAVVVVVAKDLGRAFGAAASGRRPPALGRCFRGLGLGFHDHYLGHGLVGCDCGVGFDVAQAQVGLALNLARGLRRGLHLGLGRGCD